MNRELFIEHFRGTSVEAEKIYAAQKIAKACHKHMEVFLCPGLTHKQIHDECERFMLENGAESFWTHNDAALILFGDLTKYSAHESPGSLYEGMTVRENDLITIDIAPAIGTGWGDMARSYVIENGKLVSWKDCHDPDIREGMEMEMKLHDLFVRSVKDDTTFADIYRITDEYLTSHGYINLDYHGNFGHSIENRSEDRVTIIDTSDKIISEYNKPLTFEPHICKKNGKYGIKHENMYFYVNGRIEEI